MAGDSVYACRYGLVDTLSCAVKLDGVLHEGSEFIGEG